MEIGPTKPGEVLLRQHTQLLARRTLFLTAAGAIVLALLVFAWTRINWSWSPVDDAGHVIGLRDFQEKHGYLGGIAAYAVELVRVDLTWGLFRPSYWAYPPIIYLLSPTSAHVVRLLLVLLALAGPLVHFYRQGARGARLAMVALLLLAAASSLYIGLFLVSLQELSGLAAIGVGLLIPNRWGRLVAWTVAAWFKSPFAWLLIGQAVADWRRGERRLATANLILGGGTLVLAFVAARGGSYTARYVLDPMGIWSNAQRLIEPMNALLLLSVVWWIAVTQGRLRRNSDTLVFGIGWAGYTAQLLPWGVTAYYMGPISFLLGMLLASLLTDPESRSRWQAAIALLVPTLVAAFLVTTPLLQGLRINAAMAGVRDCLADMPNSNAVLQGSILYVTTSEEGPIRMVQELQLQDPAWSGSIALGGLTDDGALPPGADTLINLSDPLSPMPAGLTVTCEFAGGQVYSAG